MFLPRRGSPVAPRAGPRIPPPCWRAPTPRHVASAPVFANARSHSHPPSCCWGARRRAFACRARPFIPFFSARRCVWRVTPAPLFPPPPLVVALPVSAACPVARRRFFSRVSGASPAVREAHAPTRCILSVRAPTVRVRRCAAPPLAVRSASACVFVAYRASSVRYSFPPALPTVREVDFPVAPVQLRISCSHHYASPHPVVFPPPQP